MGGGFVTEAALRDAATFPLPDSLWPSAPRTGWTGGEGFVSEAMLREHLPPPAANTLILRCGPLPMNHVRLACT